MSGAHHPTQHVSHNRVCVNPLEFKSVLGAEKARLLVSSYVNFEPGDPIEIVEVSVELRIPTGRTLQRYVQYVEGRVPLYSDDDYVVLHLVPARCMLDSLNRS